jgi:hypothetical protein
MNDWDWTNSRTQPTVCRRTVAYLWPTYSGKGNTLEGVITGCLPKEHHTVYRCRQNVAKCLTFMIPRTYHTPNPNPQCSREIKGRGWGHAI